MWWCEHFGFGFLFPPSLICLNSCCLCQWRRCHCFCSKLVGLGSERQWHSSRPQRSESAEVFVDGSPQGSLCPPSTVWFGVPPASNSESYTDFGACGLLCFAQGPPLSSCSWFQLGLNIIPLLKTDMSTFQTPDQDARIQHFAEPLAFTGGVCPSHSPLLGFQGTLSAYTGQGHWWSFTDSRC